MEIITNQLKLSKLILKGLFVDSSNDLASNELKIKEELNLDQDQLEKMYEMLKNLTHYCYILDGNEIPSIGEQRIECIQGFMDEAGDQYEILSAKIYPKLLGAYQVPENQISYL